MLVQCGFESLYLYDIILSFEGEYSLKRRKLHQGLYEDNDEDDENGEEKPHVNHLEVGRLGQGVRSLLRGRSTKLVCGYQLQFTQEWAQTLSHTHVHIRTHCIHTYMHLIDRQKEEKY